MANELKKVELTEDATKKFELAKERIKKSISKIETGYLGIIGDVREIYEKKYYLASGQTDFYDFCKSEFGMARGTAGNLIAISKRFGDPETGKLIPMYKPLGVRQLLALKTLNDSELKQLLNIHSIDEIAEQSSEVLKDWVKVLKGIEDKSSTETEDKSSTETEDKSSTETEDKSSKSNVVFDVVIDASTDAGKDALTAIVNYVMSNKVNIIVKEI